MKTTIFLMVHENNITNVGNNVTKVGNNVRKIRKIIQSGKTSAIQRCL